MQSELGKYLSALEKGDKISLILAGIIVDGTFEELVDDCVVLSDATSPIIKKKHYSLKVPTDSIYAWGKKDGKKEKKTKRTTKEK